MMLAVAIVLCWPVAIALILCALRGRHTQLSRTDDLLDEHADWRGIGSGADVFHNQPDSERSRNDHE
jgi:hypothetical protein